MIQHLLCFVFAVSAQRRSCRWRGVILASGAFVLFVCSGCSVVQRVVGIDESQEESPSRQYRFLDNIAYSSTDDPVFSPGETKRSTNTANKTREQADRLPRRHSRKAASAPAHKSRADIISSTFQIDTFRQRIIVNNREIHSTDTVVITNTRLFNSVLSWLGTQYRYGGESARAVDCSALTRAVVLAAYNRTLPRTAVGQFTVSEPISREQLREGDLVFFATQARKRVSHVGIFLSNHYFIHAGTSSGVTLSSLQAPYWKSHVVGYGKFHSSQPLSP